MKYRAPKTGFLRGLVAVSVSLAVLVSSHAYAFAFPNSSNGPGLTQLQSDEQFFSASALVTDAGVRLEWTSKLDSQNLGFNIYRLQGGKRIRINREIIPGSLFVAGRAMGSPGTVRNRAAEALSLSSYTYGWLDPHGTADSVYYIESVSVERTSRFHEPLTPASAGRTTGKQVPRVNPVINEARTQTSDIADVDNSSREFGYPAVKPPETLQEMSASTLDDQWFIAGQPAVKIAIKKEGWYRVTQPQMAAVGFNPTVDIRNLQLFVDGLEVAISTSQSAGLFGTADYIEFFGRGIDVPSTDARTYYLIAGSGPGKRVRGELQPGSTPTPQSSPSASPSNGPVPKATTWTAWEWTKLVISAAPPVSLSLIPLVIWRGGSPTIQLPANVPPDNLSPANSSKSEGAVSITSAGRPELSEAPAVADGTVAKPQTAPPDSLSLWEREGRGSYGRPKTLPLIPLPTGNEMKKMSAGGASTPSLPLTRKKWARKKRVRSKRFAPKREYSHAVAAASVAPSSFQYTVERRDRLVYFSSLLNGDAENWLGQVISGTPLNQTLSTPNPDLNSAGPAKLEIRLQGANFATHQIDVKFNNTTVGSFSFFGIESSTAVMNLPVSLLQNGSNTVTFTPAEGAGTTIVDYSRITYPHEFRADSDSLKFNLLGTQSLEVDGFSSQTVRLIDYTDPLNVSVIKPSAEASGGGYSITVPTSTPLSKTQRLLYASALPAEQPAAITLNQPSTLNLNTNGADFLIITTNSFVPGLAPLVTARQAQGMNVIVVDVEDVYDEFGYGLHGPQAIKDFLARTNTVWTGKPKYVVFAGDASYDPRNYSGQGGGDFVPTKLVDATYSETASDDWLADFNNDGTADIPIGRLPVNNNAEVNLVVSKIVNFNPLTPESAMLVADDPTGYYFDFEQANDQVQAQLPGSVAVQRVNVRIDGPVTAETNIKAGFNEGRAVVNYTGHGNVARWSGASIFESADATALTNGNKLSFVIVMDCLNGYYHAPALLSLSEAFIKAPGGGAIAVFASSGLTLPDGQHQMSTQLYSLLYGATPIALGDAIKISKGYSSDIDVRRTWIYFGDPSIKIR